MCLSSLVSHYPLFPFLCIVTFFFWPGCLARGTLVPQSRILPVPPCIGRGRVLTTGPPGKSLYVLTLKDAFKSIDTPSIKPNSPPLEYELVLVIDSSWIEDRRCDAMWHPGLRHRRQGTINLDSVLGHLLLESNYILDARPHRKKTSRGCWGQQSDWGPRLQPASITRRGNEQDLTMTPVPAMVWLQPRERLWMRTTQVNTAPRGTVSVGIGVAAVLCRPV